MLNFYTFWDKYSAMFSLKDFAILKQARRKRLKEKVWELERAKALKITQMKLNLRNK